MKKWKLIREEKGRRQEHGRRGQEGGTRWLQRKGGCGRMEKTQKEWCESQKWKKNKGLREGMGREVKDREKR